MLQHGAMTKITGFSPFSADGDRFELDASTTTHSRATGEFLVAGELPRIGGVVWERPVSETARFYWTARFAPFVSGARKPVPNRVIGTGRADQTVRPSIACWRDHSTGASRNRVTPMPRGSRPSMAALTRSGARKASETVMLTWRTLHRSRFAMLSASAFAPVTSSSSQWRPRAIDATKVARVSDRIGRACCGVSPTGARTSRRRVNGVLCHGT